MTIDLFSVFPPRRKRTHEVSGPGAPGFAFAVAARRGGSVLWISEAWQSEVINPTGFAAYIDPAALLWARAPDQDGVLAAAEDALRSGAVSLVVLEISRTLGLTAGRRLQLAAEAGGSTGLCLIPEGMGSNAAETRWHIAPQFGGSESGRADSTPQRWQLIKNKSGTLSAWDVRWDAETRRVIVVSEAAQRQGSEGATG